MFVVVITEKDETLNVVGPFWHENAANEFITIHELEKTAKVEAVTDRDKFGGTSDGR